MQKYLIIATACCLLNMAAAMAAQNYTISGYITDRLTGETLIGASVAETTAKRGTVTNSYGFYSLTLSGGKVSLQYSYVGYLPQTISLDLSKDTIITVRLEESNVLQEVTITANQQNLGVEGTQMSAISVPVAQIKAIPALLGEVDLIKSLQLLPGVQSGTEGFTGFYVRGGGPDENLFLLDGVPLYNINHAAGFFSVFNADAIKNVTLYKGGFPARFGSRLSSVLDIRMNDGNNKQLHGNFSIGLISSKLNLEGPLDKAGKTTYNVSARRTYFDVLSKPLIKYMQRGNSEQVDAGYYFYDINAKVSHKFSDKDRLYLSFYMGDDVIGMDYSEKEDYWDGGTRVKSSDKMAMDWHWGNLLAVLRWNRVINNKLFMNITANYTRYRFNMGIGQTHSLHSADDDEDSDVHLTYKSGIEDFSSKAEFDYAPNPNHDVKFGSEMVRHTFRPGVFVAKATGNDETPMDTVVGDSNIAANEMMLFVEDNISLNVWLKANIGLHYSAFYVQQQFYHSLQPRISLRALLNDDWSVKASYAAMSQYIHLLSNNNISLPTDLWVPVTKQITPMNSHQVSLGAFYNLNNLVDFSVEAYYKRMNNLTEYKDGASFLSVNTGWEEKVSMGRGWAYGVEFLAQKTVGKTTGWLGYTWAKTERIFDRAGEELNFGKAFPAKYDRRHDLNLVVAHKFGKRIDVSATWVYSSGNCATLALQQYQGDMLDWQTGSTYNESLDYIPQRNNYRYPDYHRLDLGFNFHTFTKKGRSYTWNVSVYNAYNSMNPFFIFTTSEYDPTIYREHKVMKKITIFPIIPSISYNYKF